MNLKSAINGDYLTNYPTYHVMRDGGVLCNKCLMDESNESVLRAAAASPGTDTQWEYVASDINYEDPSLYCDHCGRRIVSAYADDDSDEDDDLTTW